MKERYKSLLENSMEFFSHSREVLMEHMSKGNEAKLKKDDVAEIGLGHFKVARGFQLMAIEDQEFSHICLSNE